jgi:hypothetical protein
MTVKNIIPEGFPMMDYLKWRASLTGLDQDYLITSNVRGKKETHTVLAWTYLLDDDIDYLIYKHNKEVTHD